MAQLNLLILFVVLTSSTIVPATAQTSNAYILSWLNKLISSTGGPGAYPFDPSPSQVVPLAVNNLQPGNISDAQRYIYFAFIAYCDASREDWNCTFCNDLGSGVQYDSQVSNPLANTLAYFAIDSNRNEIILTFRGSINVINAVYDNNNNLVPLYENDSSGVLVHQGFRDSLQTLYPGVVTRLTNLTTTYPNYKVVVTGHSLGGSQAALAVFRFHREGLFLSNAAFKLYTYGEPRDGNPAFALEFNGLNITSGRVVHAADFAPHIVSQYREGYQHHQNEIWDVDNTDVRLCNTTVDEDPNCSNSAGPIYSIADHLVYFGLDVAQCGFNDPVYTALQAIIDLNVFIPLYLRQQLLLYYLQVPFVYQGLINQILNIAGRK